MRGWVGSRAGLDGCGKSRPPHRDSIPGPSGPGIEPIPTDLSRLLTPKQNKTKDVKIAIFVSKMVTAFFSKQNFLVSGFGIGKNRDLGQ
jgi:hypothetical protein